jgi:hypothetical protein
MQTRVKDRRASDRRNFPRLEEVRYRDWPCAPRSKSHAQNGSGHMSPTASDGTDELRQRDAHDVKGAGSRAVPNPLHSPFPNPTQIRSPVTTTQNSSGSYLHPIDPNLSAASPSLWPSEAPTNDPCRSISTSSAASLQNERIHPRTLLSHHSSLLRRKRQSHDSRPAQQDRSA